MSRYYLFRADGTTPEADLFDATIVDTLNPFGNHAIVHLDDFDGTKFDNYRRGTKVEVSIGDTDGSTTTFPWEFPATFEDASNAGSVRFTGYVVEARENNRQGADTLAVEAYSYDQFLRRNTVSNDQSGKSIENALKDIIQTDTPVTWDASNVDVQNEETLTRSYQGDKVENAIQSLRSKSANEEFGVNDSVEFFFRGREASQAPRNIDNTQWFDYDIPEKGKETVNEVTVYYDTGSDRAAVTVNDGADQQELENNLNTARPVALAEEVTYESITNEDDAKDKAEEILEGRETTLTGTVTTFGLLDADPGDIISITIDERGIDGDFRIAALEYHWADETTTVTVVENRGDQDELLVRMSDTVKRVEMRNADRSVEPTRFVEPGTTMADLTVSGTLTARSWGTDRLDVGLGRDDVGLGRANLGLDIESVDTRSVAVGRVTNNLRNAIRDAWTGSSPPSIGTVAVGDGSTTPTRTDTALGNQLGSASTTASTAGADGATFDGDLSFTDPTTLFEVGLLASGTLHERHTISDITVDGGAPIDISVTVNPSNGGGAGILTTSGLSTVTDIIADDSPATPANFVWGDDDTAPTESDTSLNNQTFGEAVDSFEAGSAGTVAAIHRLTGSELSNSTVAEFGVETSGNTLLTHTTFADFTKGSSQEVEGADRVEWQNA